MITSLLLTINGVFSQTLLPAIARMKTNKNFRSLNIVAEKGTKYITMLLSFLVGLLLINAYDLLGARKVVLLKGAADTLNEKYQK